MFNEEYLKYLKEKIEELTPQGYKVRIVKEVSYDAQLGEDENTIICVVRFGVASKKTNDPSTIIQPIIFTVFTEARSVNISQSIFQAFFLSQSKIDHKLLVAEEEYYIMPNYNSPVVQPGMNVINGARRGLLFMTGVLTYSSENVIGVKYFLDGVELVCINPSTQYSTSPITPNYEGSFTGKTYIEGANNSITLILPLMKNPILYDLLDVAILGGSKLEYILKIVYPIKSYEFTVQIISIGNNYTSETGESTLTVSFMPVVI